MGNVLIAPLPMEYGNGHRRIIQRSLIPSCFKVSDKAAKRLSVATIRRAKLRKNWRQTMKAEVAPRIVAVATMNQPLGKP